MRCSPCRFIYVLPILVNIHSSSISIFGCARYLLPHAISLFVTCVFTLFGLPLGCVWLGVGKRSTELVLLGRLVSRLNMPEKRW